MSAHCPTCGAELQIVPSGLGTTLRCPWTMAGDRATDEARPVWACKRRFRRPQDRFVGYHEPGGPAPAGAV